MRRMLSSTLLTLVGVLAMAEESHGHGQAAKPESEHSAQTESVSESLAPIPRNAPEPPVPPTGPDGLDPATALDRRLRGLLADHDRRIDGLVQAGAVAAKPQLVDDPALEDPRAARARAWDDLRIALRGHVERTPTPRRDDLDRPVGEGLAAALAADPIAVRNRLAAAEVLKDLASGAEGTAQDLIDGRAIIERIDVARLSERERALAAYLHLWFLTEILRRMPENERAEASEVRRDTATARAALVGSFPTSELAIAAEALVAGLELPAAGATP